MASDFRDLKRWLGQRKLTEYLTFAPMDRVSAAAKCESTEMHIVLMQVYVICVHMYVYFYVCLYLCIDCIGICVQMYHNVSIFQYDTRIACN